VSLANDVAAGMPPRSNAVSKGVHVEDFAIATRPCGRIRDALLSSNVSAFFARKHGVRTPYMSDVRSRLEQARWT